MNLIFKNFNTFNEEEIKLVWKMRNSESVRLKMYNPDIILFENHRKWIFSLKERKDCLYYLVYSNNEVIGVINFTSIKPKESCEWGYYLNPEIQNSGYGIILEYYILKYAFENLEMKKLYGAVIETNKKLYDNHIREFGFSADSNYSSSKKNAGVTIGFLGISLSIENFIKWKNPKIEKWLQIFNVTGFSVID